MYANFIVTWRHLIAHTIQIRTRFLSDQDNQVVKGDPRDIYPEWVIKKCLSMGDATFGLAEKFLKQVDHNLCMVSWSWLFHAKTIRFVRRGTDCAFSYVSNLQGKKGSRRRPSKTKKLRFRQKRPSINQKTRSSTNPPSQHSQSSQKQQKKKQSRDSPSTDGSSPAILMTTAMPPARSAEEDVDADNSCAEATPPFVNVTQKDLKTGGKSYKL